MLASQNDLLVQMLTSVGLQASLSERLKNEAGITSVHDLARTLDDPWQDASFAGQFGLTPKQVRTLAHRSRIDLFA